MENWFDHFSHLVPFMVSGAESRPENMRDKRGMRGKVFAPSSASNAVE
jgi:hypothetical protein